MAAVYPLTDPSELGDTGVDADALAVSLLVPSPYWESSQIGSYKLKRSLEDHAKESGRALDLDLLYATDARHKLEWLGS